MDMCVCLQPKEKQHVGEECEMKKSEKRRKANQWALAGLQSPCYFLWSIMTALSLKMKNTFRLGGGEEPGSLERLINTRQMEL